MPQPNAMWRLSARAMSRRSGSGNWAGSRLAAPMNGITMSPFGIVRPPIVTSSLGTRAVRCTGPSKRSSSSTAVHDEAGIVAQRLELLGMAQQRQHAVADQVDRRLVAGDEEEDAGGEQLVLAQLVAGLLGGDEAGEHVVARRRAALAR